MDGAADSVAQVEVGRTWRVGTEPEQKLEAMGSSQIFASYSNRGKVKFNCLRLTKYF